MAALIGALRVSLSADTAQFEQGMARARQNTDKTAGYIRTRLGGVGVSLKESVAGLVAGLSIGLFGNLIKESLEYAGHLGELADTLGLTTKDLQTFSFAAGQVGISQDELQVGIQKLTISMGQAQLGAEKQTKAFQSIGISMNEIKGKDTGDVFRMIADKLDKVGDRSQRAAVEVALFGKAGAKLDNLLSGAQGSLSELSDAAQRLGLVLSDKQIQDADRTADKLEALKTVLKADVASIVADNANAIYMLVDALGSLIPKIGDSLKGWRVLVAEFSTPIDWNRGVIGSMDRAAADLKLKDMLASHNLPLGVDSFNTGRTAPSGASVGNFLAPKAAKPKADHSAEDRLREAYQFDQQLRRAQQDTLQAQQELARDYVERTTIGIQILDAEKAAREAEHSYNIALYKLTGGKKGQSEAQVAQLRLEEDHTDQLQRRKLLDDEQDDRQKDVQTLAEHDLDRRKDILESQSAIADTASERRKIELELLDLAYQTRKQALQHVIDTSKNDREIEDARRDLANLNATNANDRQGVINQTRGPLEEWAASVPQTAAKINEALQSIEVNGLNSLADALSEVITGTKNLGDAFGDVAKSIIADLVKMAIQMLVFRALSSIIPGLGSTTPNLGAINVTGGQVPFHFANGGAFKISGMGGTDRNVLSINGIPTAMVSAGETVSVSNDNSNGGITINQTFAPNFAGNAATKDDLVQMAVMTRASTMDAIRQANRRR